MGFLDLSGSKEEYTFKYSVMCMSEPTSGASNFLSKFLSIKLKIKLKAVNGFTVSIPFCSPCFEVA